MEFRLAKSASSRKSARVLTCEAAAKLRKESSNLRSKQVCGVFFLLWFAK